MLAYSGKTITDDGTQLNLFDKSFDAPVSLEDVFKAYYDCRKNKRKTFNALAFEADYESRLLELWEEINTHTYGIGKSITFVVDKPVLREIFAADFRDRIIHHLIINKLNPLFEKIFIEDTYNCRVNKGTQYGIKRISQFIYECSQAYTKDCYILKMDIQSFFMSIDKNILFAMLEKFILERYGAADRNTLIYLVRKVVYNVPQKNCTVKGNPHNWDKLPTDKSLFGNIPDRGLPIGNLTSQIFANFYMNAFDQYIKEECGIKYYGRYVDDFIIVHPDRDFLNGLKEKMKDFIYQELKLRLHPLKIYLQHYSKGVKFIGAVIKPGRCYIGNRTKGNLCAKIHSFNKQALKDPHFAKKNAERFRASVNSYLGFMVHYSTFNLRKKILDGLINPVWLKYIEVSEDYRKISIRKIYKPQNQQIDKVRRKRRRKYRRLQGDEISLFMI